MQQIVRNTWRRMRMLGKEMAFAFGQAARAFLGRLASVSQSDLLPHKEFFFHSCFSSDRNFPKFGKRPISPRCEAQKKDVLIDNTEIFLPFFMPSQISNDSLNDQSPFNIQTFHISALSLSCLLTFRNVFIHKVETFQLKKFFVCYESQQNKDKVKIKSKLGTGATLDASFCCYFEESYGVLMHRKSHLLIRLNFNEVIHSFMVACC